MNLDLLFLKFLAAVPSGLSCTKSISLNVTTLCPLNSLIGKSVLLIFIYFSISIILEFSKGRFSSFNFCSIGLSTLL